MSLVSSLMHAESSEYISLRLCALTSVYGKNIQSKCVCYKTKYIYRRKHGHKRCKVLQKQVLELLTRRKEIYG